MTKPIPPSVDTDPALQALDDAALTEQARKASLSGDFATARAIFEEGARRQLESGDVAGGVQSLLTAARLAGMDGALEDAESRLKALDGVSQISGMRALWTRVGAELADARKHAPDRRVRWAAARDAATSDAERLYAIGRLADEARERKALDEAAAHLSAAVMLAEGMGKSEVLADVLIEQAVIRTAADKPRAAERGLTRAAALVPNDAARQARILGQRGVLALAREDIAEAVEHAQAARERADSVGHIQSLLAASQLLVLAFSAAGDERSAWRILKDTRVRVGRHAGEQGAALVDPALKLFRERLGDERIAELEHAEVTGD